MKPRAEIEELKKKVEGQNVFIIGGGPSLVGFDFDKLRGRTCIALNSSFKGIENYLTAVFWADNDWASKNYEQLLAFDGLRFNARINAAKYVQEDIKGFGNACVLHKLKDFGFTMDINSVCGNNSGAQSLNFVTNLKPHRIFLLGYDMDTSSKGKTHWHEGYEQNAPVLYGNAYRGLFIPSFNSMAPFIKQLGVDVVNCNLDSRLGCFRKDTLEKYL
jgi:hypothetical protein